MTFSYYALHVPKRSSKSLVAVVKKNLSNLDNPFVEEDLTIRVSDLRSRIESKVADGDIQGEVRLLSSEDSIAPVNSDTLCKLQEKHPSPSRILDFPDPPNDSSERVVVSDKEVRKAIYSFKNGSSGGIDGIRPQHLKDLVSKISGEAGISLLEKVTHLCNLILAGKVCKEVTEYFYGAVLCALNKKQGGIRPIAVGNTFCRLAAKLGCNAVREHVDGIFCPIQMGFGIKSVCADVLEFRR